MYKNDISWWRCREGRLQIVGKKAGTRGKMSKTSFGKAIYFLEWFYIGFYRKVDTSAPFWSREKIIYSLVWKTRFCVGSVSGGNKPKGRWIGPHHHLYCCGWKYLKRHILATLKLTDWHQGKLQTNIHFGNFSRIFALKFCEGTWAVIIDCFGWWWDKVKAIFFCKKMSSSSKDF